MEPKEFNELLKLMKTNSEAKLKLSLYCLSRIKGRLKAKWTAEQDKEDISHWILLKIFEMPPLFVFAPYKFICKITDNFMLSYLKNKNREAAATCEMLKNKKILDVPYEVNETNLYDKDEILKDVDELDAEIITLHVVEGLSHKEIAEKINLSYVAVRARYSRALKKLRKIKKI